MKFLKVIIPATLAALLGFVMAHADVNYTPGSGAVIFAFTCFSTKICPAHTPVDTAGATLVGAAGSPSTNAETIQALTLGHGVAANAMRVELPTDGTGVVTANAGTNLNTSALATSANQTNGTQVVQANAGTNLNTSALATSANQPTNAAQASTTSGQTGPLVQCAATTGAPTYTTAQTDPLSCDTAGNLRVNVVAGGGSGGTSSTFTAAFPGTGTAAGMSQGGNMVALTGTAGALNVADASVVAAINSPGQVYSFASLSPASITRSANTTTYTANTGWNNGTPTFFSFTGACRGVGAEVLIPEIDIWSSANQATKLQGVLWLFAAVPGTNVSDDATFNIAAADFANLTGNQNGFAFTLASAQASGAANSGASLTGTTYHAQCASGTTTITGMVQVVNAYVPLNAEVLHVALHTVGIN